MDIKKCNGLSLGDITASLSDVFTEHDVVMTKFNGGVGASFLARAGDGSVAHMIQASATTGTVSCSVKLIPTMSSEDGTIINRNGASKALKSGDVTLTVGGHKFEGFLKSYSYAMSGTDGDIAISCSVII